MKKIILISIATLFMACNNTTSIKESKVDWELQSLRVDDDSEYHFTAISENGYVQSDDDLDVEISIYYRNVTTPVVRVKKSCSENNGCWYDKHRYVVILPKGYKIETFED